MSFYWQICAHVTLMKSKRRECVVNYSTSCSQYDMHVLKCKRLSRQQPTVCFTKAFITAEIMVGHGSGKACCSDVFGPSPVLLCL